MGLTLLTSRNIRKPYGPIILFFGQYIVDSMLSTCIFDESMIAESFVEETARNAIFFRAPAADAAALLVGGCEAGAEGADYQCIVLVAGVAEADVDVFAWLVL